MTTAVEIPSDPVPSPPTFWRSPRLVLQRPTSKVTLVEPPAKPSPPSEAIWLTLLPIGIMAVVMIGMGMVSSNGGLALLSVPTALASGIAVVVTNRYQRRNFVKKTAEREQQYRRYIAHSKAQLEELVRRQQEVLLGQNPGPEEILRWVIERNRNLWACTPVHEDFLQVRLGIGGCPSSVEVEPPKAQTPFEPDPLLKLGLDLAENFRTIPNVPVLLSLRQAGITGLAGPRASVVQTARALLMQLAAQHSPDEVKISVVYPAAEESEWSWVRWLPHVWSDGRRSRFLADQRLQAHALCMFLDELMTQRKALMEDTHAAKAPALLPFLVVFIAAPGLVENEPVIGRILREGPGLGVLPILLEDRFKALPRECQALIKVQPEGTYLTLLLERTSLFFIPDAPALDMASRFSAALAPMRIKGAATAEVPSSITLLELLGVRRVEELNVMARWRESQQSGRSLAAPIGMQAGREPLVLDLHERVHGPNGLVAGMVGTGKSELLQTLVASLAVRFHPQRLAFVLVDYKGGGMAEPFRDLPHTLGVITNLQKGNLSVRALTSFLVEAERRQQLFLKAEVNHIDDYQRLFYRGAVKEPMPYLVIIVDEFAEMKTEQPDVAKEFVRIARIGRALGFRLLLAMQKPSGIVDGQIEANTRFRLCLRVAQTEDSQAMLKRSDAAYLTGVGRAYFQVGVNEVFKLFQVAWGGAPYDPSGSESVGARDVVEVALDGNRRTVYSAPVGPAANSFLERTQLKALTEYLVKAAAECGELAEQPLQRLCLDPLPEAISLGAVLSRMSEPEGWDGEKWRPSSSWIAPVVGLVDDPRHHSQEPLRIDLGREGHLILYGAPGYGKTTFLQTLVISLARAHSPQDVQLYLLDFGGRVLSLFEGLPHVGGVVKPDEPERLRRLWQLLLRQIEERKLLLGQHGIARLQDYRRATGQSLPAIVVVLDNYAAFRKTYEDDEQHIAQIAREGGGLGIHLVLTASSSADIRFGISSIITQSATLTLVETGEYAGIVGRTEGLVPYPTPGRGLIKARPPLEFQTAFPDEGDDDAERSSALRRQIGQMRTAWNGRPGAPAIPMLPDVVTLSDLMPMSAAWGKEDSQLGVPVGLRVDTLTPFSVDLRDGPSFVITGPVQSGKTTLLRTWLLALALRTHPSRLQMFLVDSRRMGLAALAGLPQVKDYCCDSDGCAATLDRVEQLIRRRKQEVDSQRQRASGRPALAEQSLSAAWPWLVLVIDDLLDPFDDVTTPQTRPRLKDLVLQGRRLGLSVLACGPANDLGKSYEEPAKTLKELQTGFMMGSTDDTIFNLRLPHADMYKALPLGQGHWTQRGQSRRVKVATVAGGDDGLCACVESLAQLAAQDGLSKHQSTVRDEGRNAADIGKPSPAG